MNDKPKYEITNITGSNGPLEIRADFPSIAKGDKLILNKNPITVTGMTEYGDIIYVDSSGKKTQFSPYRARFSIPS